METLGSILRSKVARWSLGLLVAGALALALVAAVGGGSASVGEWLQLDFAEPCDCAALQARVEDLEQQMADVGRQIPPLAQCCAGQPIAPSTNP